jgi:hypothetical protein
MLRKTAFVFLFLMIAFAGVQAQDKPLATGLNNPRHLFYGSDGTLYIAEAGASGDQKVTGPFGEAKGSQTSQITVVTPDGKQSVLIPELVSLDQGGQIDGAGAIYVTDDSYWVALGLGPKEVPEGKHVAAVVQYDKKTLKPGEIIDLGAWEVKNNPDKGEELTSNPIDIDFAEDGTLYIADASGNSLLSWTKKDGLKLFAAWPVDSSGSEPSAVPTSVAGGPDGDIYVGFLSGFPFPKEGARIERYSADGKLKQTYKGLTLVTDIAVTKDGKLYAVEFASSFGDTGYEPNSGRVVEVTDKGLTPIADKLNLPFGLAQTPDGGWVISVNSAFTQKSGEGEVIALPGK